MVDTLQNCPKTVNSGQMQVKILVIFMSLKMDFADLNDLKTSSWTGLCGLVLDLYFIIGLFSFYWPCVFFSLALCYVTPYSVHVWRSHWLLFVTDLLFVELWGTLWAWQLPSAATSLHCWPASLHWGWWGEVKCLAKWHPDRKFLRSETSEELSGLFGVIWTKILPWCHCSDFYLNLVSSGCWCWRCCCLLRHLDICQTLCGCGRPL